MKKGNFFKKLFAFLFLGLGALTLSACQSTNRSDARVVVNECGVRIYYDEAQHKRVGTITLAISNNTIYDVKSWEFEWDIELVDGTVTHHKSPEPFVQGIAHGSQGYVVYAVNEVPDNVKTMTITKGSPVEFYGLWQSYLVWWIIGIVIVVCSIIANAIEIFRKDITFEDAKAIVAEHAANGIVIALLVLIVCLFPLIWGAWFSTIILLGAFACCGAAALLMLALKSAGSRKPKAE